MLELVLGQVLELVQELVLGQVQGRVSVRVLVEYCSCTMVKQEICKLLEKHPK